MENQDKTFNKELESVVEMHQVCLSERKCLVCEREIEDEFILECKCNICKYCIYHWVTERNYSSLFKDVEITCPNHYCRKEMSLQWLYKSLKPTQVTVINEILFKKYAVLCKEIKKCPKNDCPYLGFSNGVKCKLEFRCEICSETWFDPEIRLISMSDRVYGFFSKLRENLFMLLTDIIILATCKPCTFCGFITYRFEGCKHITCSKCKGEWCDCCHGNWGSQHNDKKCAYKDEVQIIVLLFLIALSVLKIILSFKFLRLAFFEIIKLAFFDLLIAAYLVFLLGPVIRQIRYSRYVVCERSVYIKMNIAALTISILVEGLHVYYSDTTELVYTMNYYLMWEVVIAVSVISLYYALTGWVKLINELMDEFL